MTVDHSDGDIYVPGYESVGVYNAAGVQLSEKTITKKVTSQSRRTTLPNPLPAASISPARRLKAENHRTSSNC